MLYGAGAIPGGPLGMMGWDPSMMAGGFQPPMMDMMSAGTQPFMGAMGGVNPWMNQMMPGGVQQPQIQSQPGFGSPDPSQQQNRPNRIFIQQ